MILPFGPGRVLAHLGACLAVAEELKGRGHQVELGYGGDLPEVIERAGLRWHRVPEVQADEEQRWDLMSWYPTSEDLKAAVRARIELIEQRGPDVVISDTSVPARIACDATAVDDLTLHHFLGGDPRFRRRRDLWARYAPLVRRPRTVVTAARVRFARPDSPALGGIRTFKRASIPPFLERINEVRASLGLAPVHSLLDAWNGKVVACPTTPFLDPVRSLPANIHYVGPLSWSGMGDGPTPHRGDRPLVFVTQGSTGDGGFVRRTVEALATEPMDVAVATADRCDPEELTGLAPNVIAQRYLPPRPWLEAADAAVIHGGQMTARDAHRAGTPLAVMPTAGDQMDTSWRVERLGIGISLWPSPRPSEIAGAVRRLLRRKRYRRRAVRVAERLRAGWDGARNAADLAEKMTR